MGNKSVMMPNIRIREEELKKLNSYKVHKKQPYWEIVKKIVEDFENNKKTGVKKHE